MDFEALPDLIVNGRIAKFAQEKGQGRRIARESLPNANTLRLGIGGVHFISANCFDTA
jgi:hypothetical protein